MTESKNSFRFNTKNNNKNILFQTKFIVFFVRKDFAHYVQLTRLNGIEGKRTEIIFNFDSLYELRPFLLVLPKYLANYFQFNRTELKLKHTPESRSKLDIQF